LINGLGKEDNEQEPGSHRANRTVKQLYVDIEEGFREAVRGFQAFRFHHQREDGWVKRLRDDSLAQSRLNRAVRAHREAAHLFCAIRPYHPWTAAEHALLVDLYERSDTFLRDLGLVHFQSAVRVFVVAAGGRKAPRKTHMARGQAISSSA
jgi:hypothetical protein